MYETLHINKGIETDPKEQNRDISIPHKKRTNVQNILERKKEESVVWDVF